MRSRAFSTSLQKNFKNFSYDVTKVKKNDNCTEFRKQAVENAFMVV